MVVQGRSSWTKKKIPTMLINPPPHLPPRQAERFLYVAAFHVNLKFAGFGENYSTVVYVGLSARGNAADPAPIAESSVLFLFTCVATKAGPKLFSLASSSTPSL